MLTASQRKQFRSIGHQLNPVVMVADKGLSEGVMDELERALSDHELIKVRLRAPRDVRSEWQQGLVDQTKAEIVQSIGQIVLLYRRNPNADPLKSNLHRIS
ncbi:ribosome assembly RNA-binding protein YhbY [Litorivicinus lipolyticus]|jgi:RNA-binding protein|uniref:Ribosome assembly RNA-binding protein YhbY n=1 Tax=Litorivicinus lipolyticus TaxID=418701 RepID=A0A5Q2QCA0_9GAMM|nr:YhbY family RNA-binding protein [Litorivicinus lipolyticus]QGG79460.1 ribosome assembly RNA-binding protein YhbY [Litorivicinus lipolyticus]